MNQHPLLFKDHMNACMIQMHIVEEIVNIKMDGEFLSGAKESSRVCSFS